MHLCGRVFAHGAMSLWKERNVLFNDALNTFCLWLYYLMSDIW